MEGMTGRGPSRRDFLTIGAGVFAVSTLGLTMTQRRLVRRTVPVMGTIAEIAVVARNERTAHGAIDAAVAELRAVERMMTRFDATSDIGRANRAVAGTAVAVSGATALVVAEALRWARIPGSGFDPAIGRAVELWDVAHRTSPPAARDVGALARRGLHRHVEVGTSNGRDVLVFHDDDVALDLGGIAKGYAVDRAVAALREWGVANALVNAGGDLYALGTSLEGDDWQVGIRSPDSPYGITATRPLRDGAIATSGDYEQHFMHDGRRYHHLLDPETAAPRATGVHSLTIAAASCISADAAATALFGIAPERSGSVIARAGDGVAIVAG
ncbi:MAG TPA: FAD:protein FMN transferase [Longimicrobiales bacterium]|nr:FAD:protein FMN transferase [Longimicrobiales bacterium]